MGDNSGQEVIPDTWKAASSQNASIATACNGITFTTKYNILSTDHDKGEFIPDCCITSREAPPAYHTYALVRTDL